MKIAERRRRRKKKNAKHREQKRHSEGKTRDRWWAIHNSVRIMSLTTVALTLPDVDRFQMSSELERCQVLLSSVDIFELLWPHEAFNRVFVYFCVCMCVCVACSTLQSSVLTLLSWGMSVCASSVVRPPGWLWVCVHLAVSGWVYKGQLSVCLWGRPAGGVKKVPVCDGAWLELGQDAPALFLLCLHSHFSSFLSPFLCH